MKEKILKEKSFSFAKRIVNLYRFLCDEKEEFIISRQVLRSGTLIGAIVIDSEHSESKADAVQKMTTAKKEINETIYWLELLKSSEYMTLELFNSLNKDAVEILKMITSSIKTAKSTINQ
jgi:four helix bundle protein